MIIDTSAIIAILRREPEADAFLTAIASASVRRISAGTFLEAAIVVDANRDPIASSRFDELIEVPGIVVEPLRADQARTARDAYRDFGRGSGHPAQLNFGDCFAYALAKEHREPLLFKGDDFRRTDLEAAV